VLGEILLVALMECGVNCRSDQGNEQRGAKSRRFAAERNVNRNRGETKAF
jgi:hypothetical protein